MRGKRKSPALDAERMEAVRQAELRKHEEEQERLRQLELAARQALEEEWRNAIESHRKRQMEMEHTIREREMHLEYERRERELQDRLRGKEMEVVELRAKLCGLQQGVSSLQQERDSLLRRLSMMGNELELAQVKSVERDTMIERANSECGVKLREMDEVRSALKEELQQLRIDHEKLKRAYDDMESQFKTAKETYLANADERLEVVDPQSTDAESVLLLKVLNEEVEKHRETVRLLQAELERKGRDEEKSSVLITLLNSQLENAREEAKRLHDTSKGRLAQLESVQGLLDSEKEKARNLHRDLDVAHAEATVERKQLNLEIGVHKKQVEDLTKLLEITREELANVKSQFETHRVNAMEREQGDLQVNIALKGEVEQLKKDFNKANDELRTVTEEAYSTKAVLRAEVDSLKVRLQRLQENAERNERESFETIAVLRASEERLLDEKKFSAKNHEEAVLAFREEIRTLCCERDAYKSQVEEITAKKIESEKELYQRLLRMTANHDRLHEELERLTSSYSVREKEFLENAIFSNAEKETLRAKTVELTDTLERRKEEHANHVQNITNELVNLRQRLDAEISLYNKALKEEKERAEEAERKIQELEAQKEGYVRDIDLLGRKREDIEKTLKSEIRDLRTELSAARRTIERFEATVGDFTFKSVQEVNERLQREVQHQREKIAKLNETITSMKVESTVMETYKEKMLAEQNEKYSVHIQHLERLRQMINPIFFEMRSILEKNGLAGSLRRDLDAFDEHVRRSRAVTSQSVATPRGCVEGKCAVGTSHAATCDPAAAVVDGSDGVSLSSSAACKTLPAVGRLGSVEEEKTERTMLVPQKPMTAPPQTQEHGYRYVLPRLS
uniref:Uncharacterized protein TCIL3000_11_11130 n=1 Tax=Trypanosoma congolense (strain IL3000) TaxID=1068625 RepID=G0V1V7_TRYCI|nr:unnamed protein product [Trypanosoma congolense IL3000]